MNLDHENDLPSYDLLSLASGSWNGLDSLLMVVETDPDRWLEDACKLVGLPGNPDEAVALPIDRLDRMRISLRDPRHEESDANLLILANLLIVMLAIAGGRSLGSGSRMENEHAISGLAMVLPPSWDSVLNLALSSPELDRPPRSSTG